VRAVRPAWHPPAVRERLRRVDRWLVFDAALIAFNAALAVWQPLWVFRAITICVVVAITYLATERRHTRRQLAWLGRLPRHATLQQDGDGNWTALVTRQSGEPLVLRVPDEVVDAGDRDVFRAWLFDATTDAD
jgi:hypothetical protein